MKLKNKILSAGFCCSLLGIIGAVPVQATEEEKDITQNNMLQDTVEDERKNNPEEENNTVIEQFLKIKFYMQDSNMNPIKMKNNFKIYCINDIINGEIKEGAKELDVKYYDDYAIIEIPIIKNKTENSFVKSLIQVQSNPKTNKLTGNQFTFPITNYQKDIHCLETKVNENLEIIETEKIMELSNYVLISEENLDDKFIKWDITCENKQESQDLKNGNVESVQYESSTKEMIDISKLLIRYTQTSSETNLDYTLAMKPIQDETKLVWSNNHFIAQLNSLDKIYNMFQGEVLEVDYENNFVVVKSNNKVIVYYNIVPTCNKGVLESGMPLGFGYTGKNLEIYSIDSGNLDISFEDILKNWEKNDKYEYSEDKWKMPLYLQGSEEWGFEPYGTSTIGTAGCGPSAMSMVLSSIEEKNITPPELINDMTEMQDGMWYYCPGAGSYHSIFPVIAENYELNCNQISANYESIKSELEQDRNVIVSIGAGPYYHGDGHFIVLRDISDTGNFYINDSAGIFDLNTTYTWSDLGPVETARSIYKNDTEEVETPVTVETVIEEAQPMTDIVINDNTEEDIVVKIAPEKTITKEAKTSQTTQKINHEIEQTDKQYILEKEKTTTQKEIIVKKKETKIIPTYVSPIHTQLDKDDIKEKEKIETMEEKKERNILNYNTEETKEINNNTEKYIKNKKTNNSQKLISQKLTHNYIIKKALGG